MAHDQSDLLQGTLELPILKTLSLAPLHGWGISLRIRQASKDVFQGAQWERSMNAVNWVLDASGGST
jgi:hypothetical protein